MTDASFHIPESLKIALKEGEVVPFVGAGVSRAIEKRDKKKSFDPLFPSWGEFLFNAADKLDRENKSPEADLIRSLLRVSPPDYLEAAQRSFDGLGAKEWYKVLSANFEKDLDSADESSKKLAKLIWQLGSNLIVTTNVDSVLELAHEKPGQVKVLDTQRPEFAEIQRDWKPSRPTVLHLHGHIDNKANVVFTKKQYEDFYDKGKNQAKLDTLRSLLTQRTILFVGFSLDDLFILKELERVNLIYEGGVNSYYVLVRDSDKKNPNIPAFVHPITFPDFGPPLERLVEELARHAQSTIVVDPVRRENENESVPINDEKTRLKNHFNVPFASRGGAFVGRTGLPEKIWESLNTNGRAAIGQAVNIKGIGGLGKTQLAVEYAYKYRGEYKNGVFWLTADEDISVQLIKIGEDLKWISQFDTGFDQAELVRNRFRKLSDCLIVFDNVDDQKAIENYFPVHDAHPHILVTSREEQDGFYPINLNILDHDESRKLLTGIAEREAETPTEKEALENILKELDGLPLAVELVGGYLLRRKNISFQDYSEYLEKEPLERLEKRFPDESFTHHDKSIIRTLKISEDFLGEIPYLEEILDILAWSGKSSMGFSLMRQLVDADDDFALKDALGVALELRFIKQEEDINRFAIHRLLARVRRHEKPLNDREDWRSKIVTNLIGWFKEKDEEYKTLSEAEIESDHLVAWQQQISVHLPEKRVWLMMLRATPLMERGNYPQAKEYFYAALALYEKESVRDYLLLAHLYKGISEIYFYLGNYFESKNFLSKIFVFYEKNLIKDKRLLAYLNNNLGLVYRELGNSSASLKYLQQALKMQREISDSNQPYTANYLDNLGSAYLDLRRFKEGIDYNEQALKMRRELFGERHPHVAISLSNRSAAYFEQGSYKEAQELLYSILKMRQGLFGDKHPAVAATLNKLGNTHAMRGDYKVALELVNQSLEMRKELFGEIHPDIAESLHNIAFAYGKLKNRQLAFEFYDAALKMRRELVMEAHPHTIETVKELITTLISLGKIEPAGRLAGEFLSYISQSHPHRKFFEKHGMAYRKAKRRKKKK